MTSTRLLGLLTLLVLYATACAGDPCTSYDELAPDFDSSPTYIEDALVVFGTPSLSEAARPSAASPGQELTWSAEATVLDPLDGSPLAATAEFEVVQRDSYPIPDLGALGEVRLTASPGDILFGGPAFVAVHRTEAEGGELLWLLARSEAGWLEQEWAELGRGWRVSQAEAERCSWRPEGLRSVTRNRAVLLENPEGHETRVEPSGIETAVDGLGLVHVAASTETRPDGPSLLLPIGGSTSYVISVRSEEVPLL